MTLTTFDLDPSPSWCSKGSSSSPDIKLKGRGWDRYRPAWRSRLQVFPVTARCQSDPQTQCWITLGDRTSPSGNVERRYDLTGKRAPAHRSKLATFADALDLFVYGFVFSSDFRIATHHGTLRRRAINAPAVLARRSRLSNGFRSGRLSQPKNPTNLILSMWRCQGYWSREGWESWMRFRHR